MKKMSASLSPTESIPELTAGQASSGSGAQPAFRAIPAIDLLGGQCVRLRQGRYTEVSSYQTDPVELAQAVEAAGLGFLHLVDLDGARAGSPVHLDILRQICRETSLKVDFGGGLRQVEDVSAALAAGASAVNIGSMAIRRPEALKRCLREFGADRIILSADAMEGRVKSSGWQEDGGVLLEDFLKEWLGNGVRKVCCTDISRDGMMEGPALGLYATLLDRFPEIELIASGGIRGVRDLSELAKTGLTGAVVGRALYEGKLNPGELIGPWPNGEERAC